MDHYRTRHARAANPFHCVIEGCQMRFSTTRRLEEHVRLEHINPPKPTKETPVTLKRESCYGWRSRVYYPVRPRPTIYCPYFDEQLLKCVRFMNKHNFNVAFKPVDVHIDLKGAKRRKQKHRYEASYDVTSLRGLSIFDLFPSVQPQITTFEVSVAKSET
ncbi:unnamed protein product [Angiostrongylus costaricensis]|uniref:C2H2-type domain-containing protein n=1 Tax=Angiostrongylus costaricensis TaxID=334426 RepID=A0A0R3PKL3_ANGCS|nr:unnamed protein product [Angiostrongylus costaricensis]